MKYGLVASVLGFLLASCSEFDHAGFFPPNSGVGLIGDTSRPITSGRPDAASPRTVNIANAPVAGFVDHGTPSLATDPVAADGTRIVQGQDGRTVSLNFVNADIQEFVRAVFDEILKETVVVDPGLTGKVTVRTAEPVSRTMALDLVKQVLELNNASLTRTGGVNRIAGRSQARPQSQPVDNIRVIPVKYIEPTQAREALQPFVPQGAQITANNAGKFLILAGNIADVSALEQALATFDIDQMQGKTIALVPLKEASAGAVAKEMNTVFASDEQKNLRILAIDRMNAILLISRSSASISRARHWITRLDQADRDNRQVHVYPVQYRKAADMASVLSGMFSGSQSTPATKESPVAPGLTPAKSQPAPGTVAKPDTSTPGAPQSDPNVANASSSSSTDTSLQIRADPTTNSIIIIGRQEDYERVVRTIRTLDIQPSQVLIEATIADVHLNDAISHGVRWYLQSGDRPKGIPDGFSANASLTGTGFNYTLQVANSRLIVNALEAVTKVEIISSPALTVINNQSATLKVGDQIPILTRSSQSQTTVGAPVVSDVEMKDTGIILTVTPRVNASGTVGLDISQEVSNVAKTTSSGIDSPTIQQRMITSSVSVPSGTEIVLGGLITNQRERTKSGIPILQDIPMLGKAFTNAETNNHDRTELLIIIRPTVIGNTSDILNVTQEIKDKMNATTRAMYQ